MFAVSDLATAPLHRALASVSGWGNMTEQYGRFDQWSESAAIDAARMRDMAAMLEQRGQVADEIATPATYLDPLEIRQGDRVLEVGCGSGVVLRDVARRIAPSGL